MNAPKQSEKRRDFLNFMSFVILSSMGFALAFLPSSVHGVEETEAERLEKERRILNNGVGVADLDKIPILDRDPFDRLSLDEESKNAVFDIVPLSSEQRNGDDQYLVFALIDEPVPDRQYKVDRSHVVRILSYPELILAEATQWMDKKAANDNEERDNLVMAFLHYDYLLHHPQFRRRPDVLTAINVYLYKDSYNLIKQRKFAEALAVLEVLFKIDPDYTPSSNRPTVNVLMQGTFGKLIDALVDRHDYRLAEQYMADVDERYKDKFKKTTNAKRQVIVDLALRHKDKAEQFAAAGKGREAYEELRQMRNISPNLPSGQQVQNEILTRFPMVVVGTNQKATRPDPQSLHNWASRRLGKLYYRTLVQYAGQGEDGGVYRFPQGRIDRADDWRSMEFVIKDLEEKPGMPFVDSYVIYDRLRQLSDRSSSEYVPAWAQIQETIKVVDTERIRIGLRQAHVLPESLLQVPLVAIPEKGQLPPPNGFYESAGDEEDGHMYQPIVTSGQNEQNANQNVASDRNLVVAKADKSNGSTEASSLPKILERFFETREELLAELKRGDIDVVDRIFPSDYRQLKKHPDIVLRRYAVPTVHMLIPNWDNEYLANAVFRKAILHAIDRDKILHKEILANVELPGCEVISGPFPKGIGENDPISYGYNIAVEPAIADSYHAAILLLLADSQIRDLREAKKEAERKAVNREREKKGLEPLEAGEEKEEKLPEKKLTIALA